MENIKSTYIPMGQAVKVNDKGLKLINWVKKNKLMLMISGAFLILLVIYGVLILNFIRLIQILN